MSYVDRSDTKMYSAGSLIGLVGGYGFSRVIGPVAWIPVIAGIGSFALLSKISDRNVAVNAALAGLTAQTVWFGAAAIFAPDQASAVYLDLVVNVILMAAIYFKPGYVSAGFTALWQIIGLGLLLTQSDASTFQAERAVLAHFILRSVILCAAAAIIIFKIHPDLIPDREDEEDDYVTEN